MPPRSFRPGLHISTTEVQPQYGTQDIWIGTAKAYIKFPEDAGSRLIVHEFLAARMANAFGIPVPFGEAASMPDGTMAWASAHIGSGGQEYAPPSIADVMASDRDLLAGITVFDTWIYNPDRTDENLIWHPAVGLWAIDHESSFCGAQADPVSTLRGMRGSVPPLRFLESERPAPADLMPWAHRLQRSGKEIAARCTKEAWQRGLLTREEESAYRSFLSHRASSIPTLVEKALNLGENALTATPAVTSDAGDSQVGLFGSDGAILAVEAQAIGGSENET